jgi:hypothetical protein
MLWKHQYNVCFSAKFMSLLHLTLASRRLLHGRTEFRVLVLLLHLGIDLLHEGRPRSALGLTCAGLLHAHTTSLGHFLYYN